MTKRENEIFELTRTLFELRNHYMKNLGDKKWKPYDYQTMEEHIRRIRIEYHYESLQPKDEEIMNFAVRKIKEITELIDSTKK
jgi:hypothetical protein